MDFRGRVPAGLFANDMAAIGDMMTLIKEDIDDGGAIDLLAGGTPCQSFSIAGKRGMADSVVSISRICTAC